MNKYPIHTDSRYVISQEFTGHISGKPQYVLRYCDQFVASSQFYSSIVVRAVGHKSIKNGNPVITEISQKQ